MTLLPPSSSAGIAKTEFELTPRSGDQFLSAEQAARAANLVSLLDGDGMIYTSQGMNLSRQVILQRIQAYMASEYATSYSAAPVIDGTNLRLPAGRALIDGDLLLLRGPLSDGSQQFSLAGLSKGRYALVLETWRALVGVTTYGRAQRPAFFAGVSSDSNKPSSTELYLAGNIENHSGVPDDALVTGTLETQRGLQRQYVLRLVPETDLRDTLALSAHPADVAGTQYSGEGDLVYAVSPYSWTCYDRAVDRTFQACKLAIVEVGDGGPRLLLNVPHLRQTASGAGQSPIPCVPALPAYQQIVSDQLKAAEQDRDALRERIVRLERLTEMGSYQADAQIIQTQAEQRIFFTAENDDPLGWHDNSTISNRFVMDFAGNVNVTAHLTFAPSEVEGIDGLRGAALFRNGVDTGLRATQMIAGNLEVTVQFTAEIDVAVSDFLEIVALHSSEKTSLTLSKAHLSLRRVR